MFNSYVSLPDGNHPKSQVFPKKTLVGGFSSGRTIEHKVCLFYAITGAYWGIIPENSLRLAPVRLWLVTLYSIL